MAHDRDDCSEVPKLTMLQRSMQFVGEVFNNVLIRIFTLFITGVAVGMGWVNAVVTYAVQFLTQVLFAMPAAPPLPY